MLCLTVGCAHQGAAGVHEGAGLHFVCAPLFRPTDKGPAYAGPQCRAQGLRG